MNFKSKKAFLKWNAYGHIRTKEGLVAGAKSGRKSVFESTPGNQKITIRKKPFKIKHSGY